MSWFFLIPYAELTQDMINLSTSRDKSEIPTSLYSSQPFYVLEVSERNVLSTVFSSYKRYLGKELASAVPALPGSKISIQGIPDLSGTTVANQATEFSYTVPSNSILQGIVFGVKESNFLDYIDIATYSGETLLAKRVNHLYVIDGIRELILPKTLVLANLTIKLTYTNTGQSAAKIFVNLHWSLE